MFHCRTWMTPIDSTRWYGAKWTFTRWTSHHCNSLTSCYTSMSICFILTWSYACFQLLCFSGEFHYLQLMHIYVWWVSLCLTDAYSYSSDILLICNCRFFVTLCYDWYCFVLINWPKFLSYWHYLLIFTYRGIHPYWTYKKKQFGIRGRMADHLFQILLKSVKVLLGCDGQHGFSIDFDSSHYSRSVLPCCLWLLSRSGKYHDCFGVSVRWLM